MGRTAAWVQEQTGRPPLYSPGRPTQWRREHAVVFWRAIAEGVTSEEAAARAVFDAHGDVEHDRGVAEPQPGLSFTALKFQHCILPDALIAVGRDATYVVDKLRDQQNRSTGLIEERPPRGGRT